MAAARGTAPVRKLPTTELRKRDRKRMTEQKRRCPGGNAHSLSLCLSFGYSSRMTPQGPGMALLTLPSDGLKGIAPRSLWRPRPLIEIGDESLHKEPSARSSTGELSLATE